MATDKMPYDLIDVVFVFRTLATGGKIVYWFARIDKDGNANTNERELLSFTPKKQFRPVPNAGTVYEIGEGDNGFYLALDGKSLRFKRLYHDMAKRAEWRALDDAFEIKYRIKKAEKAATRADPYIEVLAPIIRAYQQTDAIGKRAIEARVLHALRNSGPFGDWVDA